ncbi:iron-sulfur protein [Longispora fulva]|uniref:Rieske Fe-S protein n=1 Tax=Longispora fulva TaxID=619741 RepID=A0A8J7KEG1_9ACTN|nr:Rieske (2Fe-2S) protein [Longispora fulva]MBG6135015.1 Rieske Fe-S protein [Longispora fulva]GIG56750.1 iron-sulfur protein [Longispora fulva]
MTVNDTLCRRAVLLGAGAVGATALLAACGGSTDQAKPSDPPANPQTPDSGVLAKLADIPVGGGKLVGSVLVVQPQAGVVKAFSARCTHQGTIVGTPEAGVITCPNHGSQFRADDGSLVKGPAARGLSAIAVKVVGGDVVKA